MPGTKSKQTIEIEGLRNVLDDLLFYAKPLTECHIRGKDAVVLVDEISADVFLSFRAAFHRAEKVVKPVKV
jgi:hypothetical protein